MDYLTPKQAAAFLGVTVKTIHRLHQRQALVPELRIGSLGHRRYSKTQLEQFKNTMRTTSDPSPSPLDKLSEILSGK